MKVEVTVQYTRSSEEVSWNLRVFDEDAGEGQCFVSLAKDIVETIGPGTRYAFDPSQGSEACLDGEMQDVKNGSQLAKIIGALLVAKSFGPNDSMRGEGLRSTFKRESHSLPPSFELRVVFVAK